MSVVASTATPTPPREGGHQRTLSGSQGFLSGCQGMHDASPCKSCHQLSVDYTCFLLLHNVLLFFAIVSLSTLLDFLDIWSYICTQFFSLLPFQVQCLYQCYHLPDCVGLCLVLISIYNGKCRYPYLVPNFNRNTAHTSSWSKSLGLKKHSLTPTLLRL